MVIAQGEGSKVVLLVRCYSVGKYDSAEAIETRLASLRQRYPAPDTAEVVYSLGGRAHLVPRIGPEILHHGALIEPSRQRLAR